MFDSYYENAPSRNVGLYDWCYNFYNYIIMKRFIIKMQLLQFYQ
jgi:hypothetical protein